MCNVALAQVMTTLLPRIVCERTAPGSTNVDSVTGSGCLAASVRQVASHSAGPRRRGEAEARRVVGVA